MSSFSRKGFLEMGGATIATTALSGTSLAQSSNALLSRIKMATIGAPDLTTLENAYTKALNYVVIERGRVSKELAQSWGTPTTFGRNFIVMQSDSKDDVFIRGVDIDPVPNYKAISSWGWNAIEIIVDDVDSLHKTMLKSPFRHIGGPANLGGSNASIRAAQYIGPAEDVIYLTCETGDREKSPLPIPRGNVDRPFIMILSGPDIDKMENFYANTFNMKEGGYRFTSKGGLISKMQGRSMDYEYNLGLIRLRERGNSIELDEYPTDIGPRPHPKGQLPPGVAMTSFNIDDLDAVSVDFIAEPIIEYGGRRTATFVGPVGELTELIEEPR